MEYTNCSQEAQQVTKFICYREGKLPILGPTALPSFYNTRHTGRVLNKTHILNLL